MNGPPLKASSRRVAEAVAALGFDFQIELYPEGTRSAAEAARAVGCREGQIAKSLVFRAQTSGRPVLVIASGPNRVDETKIAALLGEPIGRADADFVRARTGFSIGGVPPLAHAEPPAAFIDRDLLAFDRIWAAAGTPNAVFRLDPKDLATMAGGQVADVKRD